MGDLQQRRGLVTNTEVRGHLTVIEAEAPLAALFGYTSAVCGFASGTGIELNGAAKEYYDFIDEQLTKDLYRVKDNTKKGQAI